MNTLVRQWWNLPMPSKSLMGLKELGLEAKSILDIGACYGHWSEQVQKNVYPDASYTLIDAIDYNVTKVKDSVFYNAILADMEKDVIWYELKNTGDSFFKENTKFFKGCDGTTKRAVTLDSLFPNGTSFDIIKIDCQGSELSILAGGGETIKNASVIILEMPFMGEYNSGAPKFLEYIQYMDSIGFIPYDIIEFHHYNDILVHIDFVFIRKTHEIVNKIQSKITGDNLMELENLSKKSILIAIPAAKYIEPETFQAIYELRIPEGYRADFRFFWCYLIDQGRNTIANYAIQCGYDYLLAIDSDIVIPPDALEKMLEHDKSIISGMYKSKLKDEPIEVYDLGFKLLPPTLLKNVNGLLEVGGFGFGCVLVQTVVLAKIGYPQFSYHQAWKYVDVVTEYVDFCKKATTNGFKLYCDTSIQCKRKGDTLWEIQ